MIVVVFRADRTEACLGDEYMAALRRMEALATAMPGYVSDKAHVAEDGERLTLFEWESAETLRARATRPDHRQTKQLGRERLYEDDHLQVCDILRESRFAPP